MNHMLPDDEIIAACNYQDAIIIFTKSGRVFKMAFSYSNAVEYTIMELFGART